MRLQIRWFCLLASATLMATAAQAADLAGPTTEPSPQVADLLGRIASAYSNLTSGQFNGHLVSNFDVAGQQENHDLPFSSSFRAPNFFQHQMQGDVLLGSTGAKVYAYLPDRNVYSMADSPTARGSLGDWPQFVSQILQKQNPALLLALTANPTDALKDLADEMTRLPDATVNGSTVAGLQFKLPNDTQVTMLADGRSGALRQVKFDYRQLLQNRGAADVKSAEVTVTYDTSAAALPSNAAFAWTPPDGAVLASADTQPIAGADDAAGPAAPLVGKPAPDFTLAGFDGKSVKLSSLKGSVVVLDFWATWCGPCVMSLPNLDELYKQQSPHGLKAFAVDQQEDKDTVQAFVQKKGLTIPILLDTQGSAGKLYTADQGIPVTIIVGKDGLVKNAFVGVGPDTEDTIKADVAKLMSS